MMPPHSSNWLTPIRIVAIYAFIGAFWILFSDRLVSILLSNPADSTLTQIQTIKGWLYVAATALLLHQLIARYTAALQQSRSQLQSSERRLRCIIDTAANGILVFDRHSRIALINPAAREYLSATTGEVVGQSCGEVLLPVLTPDGQPFPQPDLPCRQVMETGEAVREIECAIAHPDGQRLKLSVNAAPLFDEHGNVDGAVASISDMTQHEQAERHRRDRDVAEARDRAKSEFLAHMSHEIRTPLNTVIGLTQMLQREIYGELNLKQRDYVNRIKSSGDHLLELINDILDLSKIEAGKEELEFAPVEIEPFCRSCLKLVQERAHEKGLQLVSRIETHVKTCITDERRLKQMLLNLLSNAIKFTPSGTVSLIVEGDAETVAISVVDTGIGIPSDRLSLLFEPFRQVRDCHQCNVQGTGLGLALTRHLARLHGGDIRVESEPQRGSRFTIYLPQTPPGYVPASSQDTPTVETGRSLDLLSARVSIIDRDRSNVVFLGDYLRDLGCEVEHLDTPDRLLEHCERFDPELVLLDLRLDNCAAGLEVLQRLRQQAQWRELPVVVMTAMAMEGDRERCLKGGASEYLSKPICLDRLDAILAQYLN